MAKHSPAAKEDGNRTSPRNRKRAIALKLVGYLGIALFVYLIIQTGPREIWRVLKRLSGLEILALLGLRALYWLIRTINWRAILLGAGAQVGFLETYGARIAGYAVSYLTPAGNIGGETTRIFMLDRVDRKKTLATVIIDKTIEFLAGIFTVAIAVVFLVTEVALPRRQKLSLFVAIAAVLLLLNYLILKQKRGLFSWMLNSLQKIRVKVPFLEKRRDKIIETDAHISEFYERQKGIFFLLFFSYFMQAGLWALEIYLTFIFLGGALTTYINCYLIVTLGSFYSFLPIPGSMGVYEMTYISLFALLKIEMSAGMAVILIRRVVGLTISGIALIPFLRKKKELPVHQGSRSDD